MAIHHRSKKLIIDYYPEGRKGPRKRVNLDSDIRDVNEIRLIEENLRHSLRKRRK